MIALVLQFGAVLLQFGAVLVVTIVLLAFAGRVRPERRTYVRLGILALGVAAVWGIYLLQERATHYAWEQDVNLGGGQSILIRRHTEFGHYGELAQINQAKPVVEDFEFIHPATGQTVRWQGQYDLEPLLLNFDNGTPYLATLLKPGKHYQWGCPPHPYAFFKYESNQWRRIGIKQFPARFEYANVLPYLSEQMRKSVERKGDHLGAYEAEREIGSWRSEEVLKIDRRIVNPIYFCPGSTELLASRGKGQYITLGKR